MAAPVAQNECDYCGLPVWHWGQSANRDAGPLYCCSGCEFAAEIEDERRRGSGYNRPLAKLALAIFLTLNVLVFTMALWTSDVYPETAADMRLSQPMAEVFRYLALLLTLPVVWLLGEPLARNTWQALRRGVLATDALLLLGVAAAVGYSAVSVFRGDGHVYFEVACAVLVLLTLGRWFESQGKSQATAALEQLDTLLPTTVRRLINHREETVPLADIVKGDQLRVLVGERIPVDSIVVAGSGYVDEQIITGESAPIAVSVGDAIHSGGLCVDAPFVLSAVSSADEGTLHRLVRAVKQAQLAKGKQQLLVDRVSQWFLPAVAVIAVMAGLIQGDRHGAMAGVMVSLATLLIACPCALGLATPLAIWTALGAAARRQIVIRRADALEKLARVRAIGFDKTGTLTSGTLQVESFTAHPPADAAFVRQIAHALAQATTHPLSRAVAVWEDAANRDIYPFAEVRAVTGRGVLAKGAASVMSISANHRNGSKPEHAATIYALGSFILMTEQGLAVPESLAAVLNSAIEKGQSVVCVGWDDEVRGVYVLREEVRSSMRKLMDTLRQQGIACEVFTGDHAQAGKRVASELGIEVQAELLPSDKHDAIQSLRARFGPVAMVGDGVNDAPALAAADVGLALGCGADVARASADVCLLASDPSQIPWLLELSARTTRVIHQNLFWALVYNGLGVGLAATGNLNPIWASAAMVVSSLMVIGNSLRVKNIPVPAPTTETAHA